jgi:hypothetical protein
MNTFPRIPLLLALLAASPAVPANDASTAQLFAPANRLVGLWRTDIYVSAEACSPGAPEPPLIGHNTMVFNLGGTLVENSQTPPAGIPGAPQVRTFGIGKWSYNQRTHQYRVLVRFDWYAASDGTYLGYQVIDRTILLGNDRRTAYGPVTSTRHAPDGSVLGRLCGEGISHRL